MQILNNSNLFYVKPHVSLIFYATLLILISIINIFSSASPVYPNLFWIQIIWFFLSVIVIGLICLIRTKNFNLIAYSFYLIIIFFLVVVLVYGLLVNGSRRWIDIGFLRLQPSEFAKISIIFATAKFLTNNSLRCNTYKLRDISRPFNLSRPLLLMLLSLILAVRIYPQISDYSSLTFLVGIFLLIFSIKQISKERFNGNQSISLSDLILIPFLLVLAEPDLGTAIIIAAVPMSMILFYGIKRSSMVTISCIFIVILLGGWNWILEDYQRQRIYTFINPEIDLMGNGYHATQSMIAIGSGGFFGKGFNYGTQTQFSFLPENHTDFAFSVLAEEWGFLGASIVLLIYLALILSMIKIASRATDQFSCLISIGAASLLFWHVFINIGMVLGLLPVVGVPLPFISYGGSAVLIQIAALGICMNVALWKKFDE